MRILMHFRLSEEAQSVRDVLFSYSEVSTHNFEKYATELLNMRQLVEEARQVGDRKAIDSLHRDMRTRGTEYRKLALISASLEIAARAFNCLSQGIASDAPREYFARNAIAFLASGDTGLYGMIEQIRQRIRKQYGLEIVPSHKAIIRTAIKEISDAVRLSRMADEYSEGSA